jgi:hypothetical protein
MKTHIDHSGNVTISFNIQEDNLPAPDGKKYLPCTACMKLEAVPMNTVSIICDDCATMKDLVFCDECHHMVKPVPFDNTRDQVRSVPSYADESGTGYETVRVGEVGIKCPCCNIVIDFSFID